MSNITTLNYFGTNTTSAGHYFWILGEGFYSGSSLRDTITWDPEGLIHRLNNGNIQLVTINGVNIIAIAGSAYDKRPGSKSVFWAHKEFSFQQLKEAILTLPASKHIIDQMPFSVNWTF